VFSTPFLHVSTLIGIFFKSLQSGDDFFSPHKKAPYTLSHFSSVEQAGHGHRVPTYARAGLKPAPTFDLLHFCTFALSLTVYMPCDTMTA
jgi:hypothetical protein